LEDGRNAFDNLVIRIENANLVIPLKLYVGIRINYYTLKFIYCKFVNNKLKSVNNIIVVQRMGR